MEIIEGLSAHDIAQLKKEGHEVHLLTLYGEPWKHLVIYSFEKKMRMGEEK